MDDKIFLIAVSVIGLVVGFAAYSMIPADNGSDSNGGYCEQIEDGIRENRSVSGPIDCYRPPPGFEQNSSSEVQNQTDIECLCDYVQNGEQRTFAVRSSQ